MGELAGDRDSFEVRLANIFDEVRHHLDERARRLLLGAMAREIGHGGISLVASTDTMSRPPGLITHRSSARAGPQSSR
jgi:ABC-type transport system involved in cytochrome c biogenesis ATPase subunit